MTRFSGFNPYMLREQPPALIKFEAMGKKAKARKPRSTSPKPWYTPLAPQQSWRQMPTLLGLLISVLLLTLIAYWPTFNNDFTNWDDDLYVADNRLVTQFDVAGMFALDVGQAIGAVFDEKVAEDLDNTAFVAGNYHPLTIFTLALNYQMTGLDPLSYQVTNVLLHLLNTFLVFLLVLALSGRKPLVAIVTAALFGLHPMHVESVSWVAERKDVLYSAFFLGGLLTYWRYLEKKQAGMWWVTLSLFLLACLSKPAAVVFPLVLLLLHYWKGLRWSDYKEHLRTVPFFALALFFGLLTLTAQIDSEAYGGLQTYSLWDRFQIAGYGFMWYIGRFIVPYPQSAFYPYPTAIGGLHLVLLILAIAVVVFAFWQRKRQRWVTFGILLFAINLLLVLQFVSVGSAIVAERYTYLPYIGLGWLVGFVVHKEWQSGKLGKPLGYGLVIVLLVFTGLTYTRTQVWANTETLFTDVLDNHPTAVVAWNNRGHYYRLKSDEVPAAQRDVWLDKAFYDYNQALAVDPNYHLGYSNRGKVWFERKNFQEAIADYSRSLELRESAVVLVNRGAAYASIGQLNQALQDFNQAIALNPDYPESYFNRGIVYQQQQQFELALADFETYLTYQPRATGIMNSMGVIYQSIGDHAAAIPHFSQAIQIGYEDQEPDLGAYFYNRALSYRVLQQFNAARQDAQQAEQLGYPVPAGFKQALGI